MLGMTEASPSIHLTGEMVKVLAHPLRARLLGLLRVYGPSTASRLAEQIPTNSGATSYHLRQLAGVGLVVEDPGIGNRRDRWWRAAHVTHSWQDTEHDQDPAAKAAAEWLIRYAHRLYARRVEDWLDARAEWSVDWRNAADQSDYGVRVTPAQLSELNGKVKALMDEYRDASESTNDDAELVSVFYYSVPLAAFEL